MSVREQFDKALAAFILGGGAEPIVCHMAPDVRRQVLAEERATLHRKWQREDTPHHHRVTKFITDNKMPPGTLYFTTEQP